MPSSFDISKVPAADSDGYINFKDAAVKIGAAYIDKNGNLVFKSLSDACDISELTYRGYEQLIKQINTSTGLILGELQIIPFSEKILYADNDGDGIPDKDDPYPDEAFDDRFMIVDDYNYIPIIDFMDINKLGTGSTEFDSKYGICGKDGRSLCYNRNDISAKNVFDYCFLSGLAKGALIPGVDKIAGYVNVSEFVRMPESALFLLAFLSDYCSGISLNENELKSIISTHPNNLYHHMVNVNTLMDMCEQTLNDKSTLIYSSKTDDVFKIACYTDKQQKCKNHIFPVNPSDAKKLDKANDWSFSVGDSYCGLIGQGTRDGLNYTLNYKVYLMDYYEWGYHVDGGDEDAHMLHECGLAKEYPIYGVFENTITWEKGYRITEPKEVLSLIDQSYIDN